jgi:D-alanine-D-alanine ligase
MAINKAAHFNDEVMLERYISGQEFTVGILNRHARSVGEIVVQSDLFGDESKYQYGVAQEIFPADIPASKEQEIKEFGIHVHKTFKLDGYSRVDLRMD